MTNKELAQSTHNLVEYIKTQIPMTDDQDAERLATRIIKRLPYLFAERPEIFSRAVSMSGTFWKCDR